MFYIYMYMYNLSGGGGGINTTFIGYVVTTQR